MKRTVIAIIALFIFTVTNLTGQNTFTNPIISGGHPDPSICYVNGEYYIVNSSFEYFPGLPIHKSKDLVNWELVGYGLQTKEQSTGAVNLKDVQSDGGIHAPTIRHHNGTFYIITTNVYTDADTKVTNFVNFIITASNAAGPWSEPHVLEGAPGIDPDIFFDDDGKVWYVGTHSPENPNFSGEGEIWLQQIDLVNWKLKGVRSYLWRGACGGVWVEGPHLYKYESRYYLMVAEGGTSFNHAVMVAVSDSINGPFISNDRNPIFTTRNLSYGNWVHSTGHADLIQLPDGRWYMVALGVRGDEQRNSNMGRETHLLPVSWETEPYEWKKIKYKWPVIAPVTGKLEKVNPIPLMGTKQINTPDYKDNFDQASLNLEWNFRRVPQLDWYSLTENKGFLRIYGSNQKIENRKQTSLIGVRQKETEFDYQTKMYFLPKKDSSEGGISIFQKDDNYINYVVEKIANAYYLKLMLKIPNENTSILKKEKLLIYNGEILLRVVSKNHQYRYEYSLNNGISFVSFTTSSASFILSKGYTGAYLGLYVHSTIKNNDFADFDWVKHEY